MRLISFNLLFKQLSGNAVSGPTGNRKLANPWDVCKSMGRVLSLTIVSPACSDPRLQQISSRFPRSRSHSDLCTCLYPTVSPLKLTPASDSLKKTHPPNHLKFAEYFVGPKMTSRVTFAHDTLGSAPLL